MIDRQFGDLGSDLGGQCRNKTVHFTVQINAIKNFAAIRFEGTAVVMEINSGKP